MEKEETLFKLEAFKASPRSSESHDFNTDNSAKTWSIDILSRRRTIRNGKVIETTTPSCSVSIPSANWCTLKSNTVINNNSNLIRLEFNVERNTSPTQRVAYIGITQDGSGNGIILYLHQESGVTYSGYIKMVSNTLPLGGNKGNTAQIFVMAYLKGSDGFKKPETPHVGSAPDWCSVSIAPEGTLENLYMLSLTALSSNQTGANRSGHIFLTCGDTNLSIPVTQLSLKITANIKISVSKSPTSNTIANCDIRSDQLVASDITFKLHIQHGASSGDIREYKYYTLAKGGAILRKNFAIPDGANPHIVDYEYSPQEDSKYRYIVAIVNSVG